MVCLALAEASAKLWSFAGLWISLAGVVALSFQVWGALRREDDLSEWAKEVESASIASGLGVPMGATPPPPGTRMSRFWLLSGALLVAAGTACQIIGGWPC